ncbi:hypothetical protein Gotur_005331 [Gossypium turneri]
MASFWSLKSAIFDREEKKQFLGFYGKEKSTDVKLPIKTDHDTLREGYRYASS